eukprot:Tbor_TRINITY_DN10122_c0_g1::TRINITY_DN10122_c0_g1_i1::g.17261::m.17261
MSATLLYETIPADGLTHFTSPAAACSITASSRDDIIKAREHWDGKSYTSITGMTTIPPPFQPSKRENIATIAFPGFLASRAQVSKYTGPDAVVILDRSDESKVYFSTTCALSTRLIHNVVPLPDVDEIQEGWRWNPIYWPSMLHCVASRWYFRTPDRPISHTLWRKINLAGEKDQECCERDIRKSIQRLDEELQGDKEQNSVNKKKAKKIVLFGFSRGAATIMHTALKLPKDIAKRIDLVVLEAPFDSLQQVLNDSSISPSLVLSALRLVGTLSPEEAYNFPEVTHLRCPIAFITSDADTRVPKKTTLRCIDAVKARYYPHSIPSIEHLELKYSRHPLMSLGHYEDRLNYIDFMQKLYDTYLPNE